MKATLSLEYIGERQDASLALASGVISSTLGAGVGKAVIGNARPRKPWVAEIVGLDSQFGFSRQFLSANWQRKDANSSHSRGVMLWFVLESGKVYEVKSPQSWRRSDRYFCTVTNQGEIVRMERDEVESWLKSR